VSTKCWEVHFRPDPDTGWSRKKPLKPTEAYVVAKEAGNAALRRACPIANDKHETEAAQRSITSGARPKAEGRLVERVVGRS